jgi:uncharacterized membrane protein YfcA
LSATRRTCGRATLELFTALGPAGALIAFAIPEEALAGLFGVLLLYVAATMARGRADAGAEEVVVDVPTGAQGATTLDRLSAPGYRVRNLGPGIGGSLFAGVASALLGVGGGIVKVPVMNVVMGVPLRVATATSNLMIGITASASAIIYLFRGGIDPYVAGPTAVGVFVGASIGSRIAGRIDVRILRLLFIVVLIFTAWQMLVRALG